jgi:hypothetical protein
MREIEVVECIQELFFSSCKSLLEGLDCVIDTVDHHRGLLDGAPIACIDAGSEEIEFKIALQLPSTVLAMTYPVGEGITKVPEDRFEDWISELSNQLLGRLKNKLNEHECFVVIGLPTSYFGADVDELLSENSQLRSYYFTVDGEMCGCSISIEVFDDALSFAIEVKEENLQQGEGEMEMF